MRVQGRQTGKQGGFTLLELMVVIALIALVSSLALPKLRAGRVSANETAALSTLRSMASAQAQAMAAVAIDTDADGVGEAGYLAELAGLRPLRVNAAGVPVAGVAGADELNPAVLSRLCGDVTAGVIVKSGYVFQVWLAGPTAGGLVPGLAEDAAGGKLGAPFPDANNSELHWCAYAWPLQAGSTGRNVYFISGQGQPLSYSNRGAVSYDGTGGGPGFDAAFTVPGDMGSALSGGGAAGADGNTWVTAQ